jgi:hypothetical protein
METKELILRAFLEFAGGYVPLAGARVATLGGRGIEAKVWSELQIPTDHGWLIERNRARSRSLIGTHRYRTHNQLSTFARILSGHGGPASAIDAFHLDLCGTVTQEALASFGPILPLILRSTGKCLAITIADARRNQALEAWPEYRARGMRLMKDAFQSTYDDLVTQQKLLPVRTDLPGFMSSFDPEKGTKRELGILIELIEFLKQNKFRVEAESIARYVYVSDYQGRFRMRTYFIRFKSSDAFEPAAFTRTWLTSALYFGRDSKLIPINLPQPSAPAEQKGSVMGQTGPTLAGLVAAAGNATITAELKNLVERSDRLGQFESVLNRRGIGANGQSHAKPAAPSTKKKAWEDYSPKEEIEWIIGALEAKAKVSGYEWQNRAREQKFRQDFGKCGKDLPRTLGGAMAHACGKFRPQFQARIREVFGSDAGPLLERLKAV